MKLCYIDAFSGISGDMTVGALLDAGASFAGMREALDSLGTGASFRLEKTKRRGIAASKFFVDRTESTAHRHLHHIVRMIEAGELADEVKQDATAIFTRLAESEAKAHNTTIERVHFHEVGAVDSICDIVGACFCFHDLGVGTIGCSAINVGSGTVNTEHGVLPVPAPATADLLTGKPIYSRGPAMELTTPTGAAIVATLAKHSGPMPAMTIKAAGYGAGDRDFLEHANVVRVLLGEPSGASEAVTISVIEANLDDSTPQVVGHAMELLLEAGALDVTLTPIYMKKSRPAVMLTILAKPEDTERMAEVAMRETTTLGVRIHAAERRVLAREFKDVETPYGRIRVKTAGGSFTPEYDDCRRVARENNVPLKQVIAQASAAFLKNSQ